MAPPSSAHEAKKRPYREVRFGPYVLGSTLGEGEFGKVKMGWRKDGKHPSQAAIKLIRRDSLPRGSEREYKVHREISALKKLVHPNIVRLEEVLRNDKYIGIVLEYASGGELFDYISEHRHLKDSMACRLFAQLISGVWYMHSKGIVHRDLKLENLLLDKHKNVIITDFGFVNTFQKHDLMKTSCGSPCYAAPELVLSNEPYESCKADVWSLGVILYAMLAGYLPFDDDPQNPDGDNILRLYHYITHTPLTFPEYIQPMPRDLLRRIIVPDPKKRIDLEAVRSHRWLSPHASLLSRRPQEWERRVEKPDPVSRRLSLMEQPTSRSLFVSGAHHARSYSHKNNTLLYSHPAAPQTSSSHAIVVPFGSDESVNSPYSDTVTRHTRSRSSASVALQAVAEAEKSRSDSFEFAKPGVPRSATHQGNLPLSEFEPISEDRLPPLLPSKMAARGRPRPTSYHPSSSSYNLSSSTVELIKERSISPEKRPGSFLLSPSPSPERSPFREPHVNMTIANGTVSPVHERCEKRKSVAVDSLSHAIDNLDLEENKDVPSEMPEKETSHKTQRRASSIKIGRTNSVNKQEKSKRFSLLANFYPSSYSESARRDQRKALEPRADLNVLPRNDPPKASHDLKRMSLAGAEPQKETRDREVSAAKKVMDFFKRRSIRI